MSDEIQVFFYLVACANLVKLFICLVVTKMVIAVSRIYLNFLGTLSTYSYFFLEDIYHWEMLHSPNAS